jgi:flavin reductase ActVB
VSAVAPARLAPVPREVFAEAMTRLVSGVTVVTARRASGQACGLLVSSICSYSADPPSLLIAVGNDRASHPALVSCAEFGVHMLGCHQAATAAVFASSGTDKFAEVPWSWYHEVPRLHQVPVFLRCSRRVVFPYGDHTIIIGEVGDVEIQAGEPMVYYRRRLTWRLG